MKEKNKTYTAADFARYHAGTMPADEMHALEKAALEDPFLDDALEGYRHLSPVESDIEELQLRLDEKRKKKNAFFIISLAQNKWWRIAALFIVMGGAGYFFYKINYTNKENSLAKNEVKIPAEKKDSPASVKTDSTTTRSNIAFENQRAPNPARGEKATLPGARPRIEKEVAPPAPKTQPVSAYKSAEKPGYSSSSDSIRFKNSNEETRSQDARGYVLKRKITDENRYEKSLAKNETKFLTEKKDSTASITGYVLKGKITDENGNAVPYANIKDKTRNNVTIADTAGRFSLRSGDSSITAMASATGYDPKSFSLNKDMQPTIALNKRGAELNEVVVTGLGQSKRHKKSVSASRASNGKVAGVQITSDSSRPSGGWEKFDQYLKENTSPIYNENNERLTGEVFLSFTINKKGRPKNIKVLKSSCEDCEEKAIQLLENGPGWTGNENKQETVVIKF